MFKICAAILNFGNMKFKQKPRDEQAEVVDPAGKNIIIRISKVAGFEAEDFLQNLVV